MNRDRAIGTTIVKPIVYGNKAVQMAQKNELGHTHQWTVYLKPYNVESLGKFIRRVQFKLHTDYENNTRNVDSEPFEVTETGWGEFTVHIRIYFIDSQEKQANCQHYIALHQPVITHEDGQPVVIKEVYDELVFINPTNKMYDVLHDTSSVRPFDRSLWHFDYPKLIEESNASLKSLADQAETEVVELTDAIEAVSSELQKYRDLLKQSVKETKESSIATKKE